MTTQLGFYFDQSRCIGCYACVAACRSWHRLDQDTPDLVQLRLREKGEFPKVSLSLLFVPCLHCAEPRCQYVCPAEAISKDSRGIVAADGEKCRSASRCGLVDEAGLNGNRFEEIASPCQAACPAGVHIPGFIALLAKGKTKEALDLVRERMPLPSVCGRICMAPCEGKCQRGEVDEPVAVNALKRFVAGAEYDMPGPLPRTKTQKVAIAGSGPAGLAAAVDLARLGYGVTIFEAAPVAGGWLAMGIPDYRLPKDVLKKDIKYIEALGVEIRVNTPLGGSLTPRDLLAKGYGAVLLATGAHRGQQLDIPGASLAGVTAGTVFLRELNLKGKPKVGKRVLVIGGGNVAIDSARSARRLGAAEVHLACLETREQMPATPAESRQAEEEGIVFHPALAARKITGKGGRASGVELVGIKNLMFDGDGRPRWEVIAGSEQVIAADTVIVAIGQAPEIPDVVKSNVQLTARGTIAVEPDTLMTSSPGIFAAGDAVRGPRNFVEAVADGHRAALGIDAYLQNTFLQDAPPATAEVKFRIPADVQKAKRQVPPSLPAGKRVSTFSEVEGGLSAEAALNEAKRCLNCAGHLCRDVCPYEVPRFTRQGRVHIVKCDMCLDRLGEGRAPACEASCPTEAIDVGGIEELQARYGDLKEIENFPDYRETRPSITFRGKKQG